ncbi:MAG TPA: glycine zipper 2TM domain-containing protein [Gammaproteobacteria bacterium]|nr:glycine zipper 2TM domain-containing protein [Gammaproteobacteria bacterium]
MWVKSVAVATIVGFCAAGNAFAGHDGGRYGRGYGNGYRNDTAFVYARVVDVQPMVRYVTVERPRRECWDEIVQETSRPSGVTGPTIAGGVVGAAIGRQFGGGSGRDALTLIGAVVGSAVANQRAVRNHGGYTTRDVAVQRCETVNERFTEERTDGYLVTYRYQGRNYTMQTDVPPGDQVRLAVDVRPVGYRVRY